MAQLFTNNAASTLASGISVGAVSLTVFSGEGAKFPSPVAPDYALVTIYQKSGATEVNHEIVKLTARTGDGFTIVRAQEGTTARAFNAGDPIELRWTAGASHSVQIPLLKSVSGVNAITASSPFTLTAQAETGSIWKLPAVGANTGAVTLNIDGMGAVAVVNSLGGALIAGDIAGANYPCILEKRAADFVLINPAMPHGAGTALTGTALGLSIGGHADTSTTATTATTATNNVLNDAGSLGVGVCASLYNPTGTTINAGAVIAGQIKPIYTDTAGNAVVSGTAVSGTWRNISGINATAGSIATYQRIA